MERFVLGTMPDGVLVEDGFEDPFEILLSDQAVSSMRTGKLVVRIRRHGGKARVKRFSASIAARQGRIDIFAGDDNSEVFMGQDVAGGYELRLWRKSRVSVGSGTTSNGTRIFCDNSEFVCGEDCMFSSGVVIQTSDQHGIVDLESGRIVNDKYRSVRLGDHVWLGRQCVLMPDAEVGDGSIVGACAVVVGAVPKEVIVAGVPARVIKEKRTWSRSPMHLDSYAELAVQKHKEETLR